MVSEMIHTFLLDTGLEFQGCRVCLVNPAVSPPASLGGLFARYFKKIMSRSSVMNVYDVMNFSLGIREKLVKGERVLTVKEG